MSALAIIVVFKIGSSIAVYCTAPAPFENVKKQFLQMTGTDHGVQWAHNHPGLTPPNIIVRGHPNYNDALNGKIIDDPDADTSITVPPCKPFPDGT